MLHWLDTTSGIIISSATAVAFLAGAVRWWTRHDKETGRPKAWPRRAFRALDKAVHTLIGWDAVTDPHSGEQLRPAVPGVDQRMAEIEQMFGKVLELTEAAQQFADSVRRVHTRIDGLREELSTSDDEIQKRLDQMDQILTNRLDKHAERLERLEATSGERIASHIESAEAWRAMGAIASGNVPEDLAPPEIQPREPADEEEPE